MKWILLFSFLSLPVSAEPVCARDEITLRRGPGSQHPVTWKVAKYMPFMRKDRKSNWVKVEDLEGEAHWARASDLTNKIRCVVVRTNIATLRREPSSTSATIDLKSVDRYTPFKRIDNDREWVRVEDETGRQAWIHESQVWKPVTVQSFSF